MDRPLQADGRLHGVVVACRDAQDRWLLIRRGHEIEAAPGAVCFPGGAIEVGESQEVAAVREMREELGVAVELVSRVWHHQFEDKLLTLWAWLGRLGTTRLQPDPTEVAEVLWLTADEAASHPDALRGTDTIVRAAERGLGSGV